MSHEPHLHIPAPEEEILDRKKKLLRISVVTPEGEVFSGKGKYVNAWSPVGSFRILYNHAPMISFLAKKQIEIGTENGGKILIKSSSGILEVLNNQVRIAVEQAEVFS